MLFIKNCTRLEGNQIKVRLSKGENNCGVSLEIDDNNKIDLLTVANGGDEKDGFVDNDYKTIERSFNNISTMTNVQCEDAGELSTVMLDKKPTEISFFIKGQKVVIKNAETLPVGLGVLKENDEQRYPRDMVIFVLPKVGETPEEGYRIDIDTRNIGARAICKDLQDYRIIVEFIKYPIWANLKFPVYGLIYNGTTKKAESAFKLGYQKMKTVTKNSIIECDVKEASDYLAETKKIKEDKNKQRPKRNDGNRPYNNDRKPVKKFNGDKKPRR